MNSKISTCSIASVTSLLLRFLLSLSSPPRDKHLFCLISQFSAVQVSAYFLLTFLQLYFISMNSKISTYSIASVTFLLLGFLLSLSSPSHGSILFFINSNISTCSLALVTSLLLKFLLSLSSPSYSCISFSGIPK